MENWIKTVCPKCKRNNWVCSGDPEDLTIQDPEIIICHNCDHKFLIDRYVVEYYYDEEQAFEEGNEVRGKELPS